MTDRPMREARVDLAAIRVNLDRLGIRDLVADVAGDAFGHGAVEVARAAQAAGIETMRVRDTTEEGVLRDAAIHASIDVTLNTGPAEAEAMYGLGPLAAELGLSPAMRVSARVISLKTIEQGEPVSYGYTWRARVRSNLALVPLGYADGVARSASNRGQVWLGGAMRNIVGRVAMDVIVLDLGADEVELGAEAVLFGDPSVGAATADAWAESVGMTPLEATCSIGARVTRSWAA